ncbi:MAG: hypothetical protein R3354_03790 [Thiohalomonadales bacterium]|nr:hypothetical protein [Thiohalomonadales bacterium]
MWKHLVLASLLLMGTVHAAEPLQEDNQHIRTWNRFAEQVYALHQQLIQIDEIHKEVRHGGYAQMPEFYREERFYEGDRLISKVQWEKANPDQLHTIEVYIYDDQGRVTRDYIVAYLPTYRNAPVQTLISLHRYQDGLHAFRSFDASGYRVVERCTGNLNGRDVNLLLDEDEIYEAQGDPQGIMASATYRACFGNLQTEAGKYLTPQ